MRGQRLGERAEHLGASARRERAPRSERALCGGDRLVDLLNPGPGDVGEDRLRGRLEDLQSGAQLSALHGRRRDGTAGVRAQGPPYGAWETSGRAISESSSSTVRIGPLKVFFAETENQMVTATIVPIVTIGA